MQSAACAGGVISITSHLLQEVEELVRASLEERPTLQQPVLVLSTTE